MPLADPVMRATFKVHASIVDRIRFWFRGVRYRDVEFMPAGDSALLIECGVLDRRLSAITGMADHGVSAARACWRWKFLSRLQAMTIPRMRVINPPRPGHSAP